MPALTPLLGRLLRSPLKSLLERAIDTLPEGPAEEDRRAVRWTIVAGANGEDGRTARGIVQAEIGVSWRVDTPRQALARVPA